MESWQFQHGSQTVRELIVAGRLSEIGDESSLARQFRMPSFAQDHRGAEPIARHAKAGRHAMVMDPRHYAGLLRPGGKPSDPRPPHFDPAFLAAGGEVAIRGLDTYAAAAGQGSAL
jgi:hypothetical protein